MCHFFFGRQIVSYNKGVVLVNLIKYRIKLSYYVSNLPFVIESNFKDRHPLINDELSTITFNVLSLINKSLIVRTAFNG